MKSKVIMLILVSACCGASQAQTIYLSDNFDIYSTDADVTGAGWGIVDTPAATEDSTWTITNPGGRANPPTIDGTASTGKFMISDSDAQSVSGPQDTGASHDLHTPTFSTVGGGVVWLHVDVSAQLNNNGECIFFVDVSGDGGDTWTTVFQRVAPGRTASTFPPDNTNVGGYFGRLDINLTPYAADKGEVKIRFRHYEPSWDWWIAIDNVQVDDMPPPAGGRTIVFSEDFSSKTLGDMIVDGLNTGTETWTTRDGEKGNRYQAGTVGRFDGHAVDRLMHPASEGPNGEVEFAILDSDANPDPAEDEYLMTPLLNLTGETNVFLHFKDEIVVQASESVLLMQESNGNGIPDRADTVLTTILDYATGALRDPGEEPYYHERVFSVAEAAGLNDVFFAFRYQGGGDNWWWAVDDVMVTAGQPVVALARDPSPADGATFVSRSAVLRWMPGLTADRHDVYFGTDKDAVQAARISDTTGVYRGRQTAASYPVPETLAWGQAYYWRVDEVGPAPASTVYEGDVWLLTVEPFAYPLPGSAITASASSNEAGKGAENTVNGSGLDGDLHSIVTTEMWLSAADGPQPTWIRYEFDRVYKLHEMWAWNYNGEGLLVVYGLKDVDIEYSTDGTIWAKLDGVPEFAKAPGASDYAHKTVVDFGGVLAKYVKITANSNWSGGLVSQYGLSEVRFHYVPVWASEPDPEDGTTDIGPDVTLRWRTGREAATHDLYLSTNRGDVVNGAIAAINVAEAQYDAGTLDLGKTHYWKIVEINDAETPTSWAGDVWDFTVVEHFVVDDMESYGDAATPGEPGSRIFYTWRDGLGWSEPSVVSGNGSGSIIGYAQAPFDERSTVRSGGHAMPYEYRNGSPPYYSEATAAIINLPIGPDWTRAGAKALSLWFYGRSDNVPDQMYVKLNGAKVPYEGNLDDLTEESWHEWNIDLSSFGVDLGNVTEIGIGFGSGTGAGGSGLVLFDAIRLYPSKCVLLRRSADFAGIDFAEDCVVDSRELEAITESWLFATADPGGASLVGWWKCDGDMQDSSGSGNHGTIVGDPIFVSGMVGSGALELSDEDYVTMDGVADDMTSGDMSMGAWVRFTNSDEEAILSINTSSGGNRILMEHIGGEIGMWESGYEALSGVTVNDGAWHHAMYTQSGSLGSLYVDGVLRDTHTASFSLTSDDLWSVGQEWDTDSLGELVRSEVFNGTVDDVRVYNRALTDGEVAHLLYLAGGKLPVDLHEDQKIDLKDYAALADVWLDAQLWP